MTAITGLWNTDNSGTVLLFYADQNGQLAYILTPVLGAEKVTTYSSSGTSQGVLRNPSQLAAIKYQNLYNVIGIDDATNGVVLVSPGYSDLSLQTGPTFGSVAASSDSAQKAWVYYLQGNPMQIMEYDLTNQGYGPLSQSSSAASGTSLAACYDGTTGTRHLIAQSSAKNQPLMHYSGKDESPPTSMQIINETGGATPATAIAVCVHPSRTLLHIYYRSSGNSNVNRIAWDGANYIGLTTISGPNPDQATNISAVPSNDGQTISLFYIYDANPSTKAIHHGKDTW